MRILYLLGRNIKFLLLGLFHKLLNYKAIGKTQGNMAQKMPDEIGAIARAVEKITNPDHESINHSIRIRSICRSKGILGLPPLFFSENLSIFLLAQALTHPVA